MALFYDSTESREGSRLPSDVIEYGYRWDGVEAETGGDFIVTPGLSDTHKVAILSERFTAVQIAKKIGVTISDVVKMQHDSENMNNLLYEYLYRGALVVQRKSGGDLLSSIQSSRLDESLARMNRAVPYSAQRVLLYTGVFSEHNGKVALDGRVTGMGYMAFAMALTAWSNKGGVTVNLSDDSHILKWVQLVEEKLDEYKHTNSKMIYSTVYYPPDMPDVDDALQMPIEVNDWRKTMVTFPGLGPDRVNSLRDCLVEKYEKATLWSALQHATSPSAKDIHGWGPKSIESVRRWLGIPDGWELVLQRR